MSWLRWAETAAVAEEVVVASTRAGAVVAGVDVDAAEIGEVAGVEIAVVEGLHTTASAGTVAAGAVAVPMDK